MKSEKTVAAPTLHKLMPHGYTTLIAREAGAFNIGTIVQVVNFERHTSKYWAAALKVAEAHNPAGFALWAAANPEKVPAKMAA